MAIRPWPEEAERLRKLREKHEAHVRERTLPECDICGERGGHKEYCVKAAYE